MQVFLNQYRMTPDRWLRLLALSVAVNVMVVVGPIAVLMSAIPGGGILAMLVGIPLGIGIAIAPAMVTIVIASLFAHLRGYFSFLQFAVIGTLVSCAIAARAIASGNGLLLDHIHTLISLMPFAWCAGWMAAHYSGVLPAPMGVATVTRPNGAVLWKGAISIALIAVPAVMLSVFATSTMEIREQQRAAELRGQCPAGQKCAVYGGGKTQLDPAVYVANLAGQQFLLTGNSLHRGIRNAENTPGRVAQLHLFGLLPSFAPRSAANFSRFEFPSEDVAYVEVRPICSPSGVCNPLPHAYSESPLRPAGDPVYVATDQHFAAPPGFTYLGDINGLYARSTTPQNADRHAYANDAKDELILCHRLLDVPNPSCMHTFSWNRFRVEARYQPQWLASWSEIKAHIIAQLEIATTFETIPAEAIHIVDPLQ